jgi:dehydrogenase/reductase SDR family member 12
MLFYRSAKPRVIIVTSGGMLTQKLDADDLQFAKMKPFDGTMAYAQNKRQQVLQVPQF